MSHLLLNFLFHLPFRLVFSLFLFRPHFSLSFSFVFSSLSVFFLCLRVWCCGRVVVVWCGVSCCVVLCSVVFWVRCGVWCVVCVRPKRLRVYRHHAHMLKHMCAWCRYTRGWEGGESSSASLDVGFISYRQFSACHERPTLVYHVLQWFTESNTESYPFKV